MRLLPLLPLLLIADLLGAQTGGLLRGKVLIEDRTAEEFDAGQGDAAPEYVGLPGG